MANNENFNDGSLDQWTEYDAYQLYKYIDSYKPRFAEDPIVLAQEFQKTMDEASDAHFRKIMGAAGEETLNQIAPNQITYRHLAIVTSRLIVFSEQNGQKQLTGDISSQTLVTGLFDRFAFEDSEEEPHVEKDWLTVRMVRPNFLYASSRDIAIKLFDANKNLIALDANSTLTIPVDAVKGRVYDPEALFQ